jgi:hypothetical protein
VDVAVAEPAKQPLSLLVEHEHMFSVGEGMLLIDSIFRYDIRYNHYGLYYYYLILTLFMIYSNGPISSIDILVDARVRVLSVEGANLKRWDLAQGSADEKSPKTV